MRDMFLLLKHVGVSLSLTYIIVIHPFNVYNSIYQTNNRYITIPVVKLGKSFSNVPIYIAQPSPPSLKPAVNTLSLLPIFCTQISLRSSSGRKTPNIGAHGSKGFQ